MPPTLKFDNSFVRELPGDPDPSNRRRQVTGAAYSRVAPTPVGEPRLLAYSREVAELLALSEADCNDPEFAEIFAGNRFAAGMEGYAACYGGHQFGTWAGQLGDGRAISLGEVVVETPRAHDARAGDRRRDGSGTTTAQQAREARSERWELQLKGAGLTPYSRTADGRAVLRSSVREFLCSEAMYHLGVPTTRALSLVETGERVVRDMFYDGHPRAEPGAVVCRVAPSFLRFGNFEILTARAEHELLRRLADYAIATHFPELVGSSTTPSGSPSTPAPGSASTAVPGSHPWPGPLSRDTYVRWFDEVCRRTAVMITHWMRVGFVHGVMNTDNMSILGLTIDYGPYGWLEDYDPDWTPNTTDATGRRYRYGYQPMIALWNLSRFGGALMPLVGGPKELEAVLESCQRDLERQQSEMLSEKLGLDPGRNEDGLADELPALLQLAETDVTIFYRNLADLDVDAALAGPATAGDEAIMAPLMDAYYAPEKLGADDRTRVAAWLRRYAACVRAEGLPDGLRRERMNAVNPKYVLRNYLAQLAIDQAEQGDPSLIHELLDVLRAPYTDQPGKDAFAAKRPEWARHRPGCSMLSCSS